MKRLLALILILCFALSVVSCTVVSRVTETSTEEKKTLPATEDATQDATKENTEPEIYLLVDGKKTKPEYVLEMNGTKISFEEFRYNYLLAKQTLLEGMSVEQAANYWNEETEKKLLDDVIDAIRNEHSFLEYAADNKITLTEADQKQIDASIEQAKSAYGEESLLKQLRSMFIPDYDFYRLMVERTTLTQSAIPNFLYGENGQRVWNDQQLEDYVQKKFGCSMEEYYQNNYLRAKHILIQYVTGESKDNCTKTLEKINEVYDKLKGGADFDECIKTYNEDPGMTSQPDGYVFAKGTMVEEFYEGTKALSPDSYSQPVQTSYGYHIILRLPLTDEGLATAKEEMLFGGGELTGAYKEDFPTFTKGISDAYKPEIKMNPAVEGHINHDSVF